MSNFCLSFGKGQFPHNRENTSAAGDIIRCHPAAVFRILIYKRNVHLTEHIQITEHIQDIITDLFGGVRFCAMGLNWHLASLSQPLLNKPPDGFFQ